MSQAGACVVCGVQTIHRCEHASYEFGYLCFRCRYAVHLGLLLRGEDVDPRYLQDDQLLVGYADAGNDANMISAEALRKRKGIAQ